MIIGSLLWQDHLNIDNKDMIRHDWRNKFLDIDKRLALQVPIRYGRRTKSDGIYTMVYSKGLKRNKYGVGYLIPFKNIFHSFDEIIVAATAFYKAEGMKDFVVNWAAITIQFNPSLNKVKNHILKKWQTYTNNLDTEKFKFSNENSSIKRTGELNFKWFKLIDSSKAIDYSQIDFLLTTVTAPTNYPSIKDLAVNVKEDTKRFYFINNIRSGIFTFNDISIINNL